ncbi:hypothetical protein chiPu_0001751 [Chiloscyllium punctatum]|uniref:Uncharacterized protein n=1 Tax=Chiloscyllium punctatum TaxID=137246 RepID=A0A401RYW6_CHIPU|nr:hypothetical protein [Chiloscyllium punctatum]
MVTIPGSWPNMTEGRTSQSSFNQRQRAYNLTALESSGRAIAKQANYMLRRKKINVWIVLCVVIELIVLCCYWQ